jgi:chromosome partitioning protein
MKTIVVTSQKGGSGKTTIVAHLAVEAARTCAAPVWIVDTDRQGTLSRWHERREAETPQRAEIAFSRLAGGVESLKQRGAAFCFIDTAPTISSQNAAIVELADLVLIPVRPSPADFWAVAETVVLVRNAGKPFMFVMTQAKPQASITAQTIAALSQHGRVAEAFVADRVAYAVAMTGGRTAAELAPKSPAAAEIADVWRAVKSCFHENGIPPEREVAHG